MLQFISHHSIISKADSVEAVKSYRKELDKIRIQLNRESRGIVGIAVVNHFIKQGYHDGDITDPKFTIKIDHEHSSSWPVKRFEQKYSTKDTRKFEDLASEYDHLLANFKRWDKDQGKFIDTDLWKDANAVFCSGAFHEESERKDAYDILSDPGIQAAVKDAASEQGAYVSFSVDADAYEILVTVDYDD